MLVISYYHKKKAAKCLLCQLQEAISVPLVDGPTKCYALIHPARLDPLLVLSLWLLLDSGHSRRRWHNGPDR